MSNIIEIYLTKELIKKYESLIVPNPDKTLVLLKETLKEVHDIATKILDEIILDDFKYCQKVAFKTNLKGKGTTADVYAALLKEYSYVQRMSKNLCRIIGVSSPY